MNAQLKPMHQGSPEWLQYRQSHRNASETPTVMCLSPWYPKTHKQLARLKRGLDTMPDNPAMAYGREHEAEVRRHLEKKTGLIFEPAVMVDGDYSASLDGITLDGETICEVKAPGPNSSTVHDARRRVVPGHYAAQICHQLAVSKAKRCIYAVLAGDEVITFTIEPDPEYWERIQAAWNEFWPLMTCDEAELTEYAERTDDAWRDAVAYYRAAKAEYDSGESALKDARARLIALADKQPSEGFGVRVMRTLRAGAVDYSKVPELAGVDLEPYRKRGTECWQLREVKPS